MKILVIGAVDTAARNATSLHLFSMADFLSRAGHDVSMIVPKPSTGTFAYPVEDKDIKIQTKISAKSLGLPNTVSAILHLPSILWSAWRNDYDVIYIRMSFLTFVMTGLLRLFGKHIIVSEHNGWIPDEGRLQGHPRWLQKIEHVFQSFDGKWAHLIRSISPETKQKLVEVGCQPERVFIGENGTDLERMQVIPRQEAVDFFKLDPKKKYIGFLGNLAYWQGIHILIEAALICLKDHPDWEILVAGDGIEKQQLMSMAKEKAIDDKIHFLGGIKLQDANKVVNCFDIAVAPFIEERNFSPIKIRDYAGAGRAVVSSNVPGVRNHTSTTWLMLHKPDDANHLAECLLQLMSDEVTRKEMGDIARQYAEAHYSWDKVAVNVINQVEIFKEKLN